MASQPQASYTTTTGNASLLDSIVEKQQEMAARYQPVMDIQQSIERYEQLRRYVDKAMIEGEDYGKVDGIPKPFLFQAGAEKLCVLFGYVPHYETEVEIEDWAGEKFGEPLFYYRVRCIMQRDGKPVGEGIGSASSWESKHRYRWLGKADVPKRYLAAMEAGDLKVRSGAIREPAFAIDKAETSGRYGKPAEYWAKWHAAIESGEAIKVEMKKKDGGKMDGWEMGADVYRVPNPDFADVINTCQKIAVKRAKVAAAIAATGLSSLFTQDEDSGVFGSSEPEPPPASSRQQQKAEPKQEQAPVDPPELAAMFKDFSASKGKNIGKILQSLEDRLIGKHADAGAQVFNTISKAFSAKYPDKDKRTADAYRQLIRNLFDAAEEMDKFKADTAAGMRSGIAADEPDLNSGDPSYHDHWEEGRE